MRPTCSRPDCAERGVARALIDPRDRIILLDRRVDEAGAAILCQQHADRVTVPKGWTLDDRRDDNPRLFGVARFSEPKGPRERLRRLPESIAAAVAQLPLETATPYEMAPEYESARHDRSAHPEPSTSSPEADAGSMDENASVTQRALARAKAREQDGANTQLYSSGNTPGPLLARAFDAARSRVRSTSGLTSLIPPADGPLVAGAGAGA